MPRERDVPVIYCRREKETGEAITRFSKELRDAAAGIGSHGLPEDEFWDSGLFHGAIEKLRGQQAASMADKRKFMSDILNWLQDRGGISAWKPAGSNDRHDYEVILSEGRICAIETKGCLDGNNTNIYQRPPNADEFVIWSLCQNPGADPRKNAWSGIHTRLSAEIVHKRELVDGLVIWDGLCGTIGRPCPKLKIDPGRITAIGRRKLPPPCIYLFPRSVPDPRNNPAPRVHKLKEVQFLKVLYDAFGCKPDDITEVKIEASMKGTTVARSTMLVRDGETVVESRMTPIRRAKT